MEPLHAVGTEGVLVVDGLRMDEVTVWLWRSLGHLPYAIDRGTEQIGGEDIRHNSPQIGQPIA